MLVEFVVSVQQAQIMCLVIAKGSSLPKHFLKLVRTVCINI